MIHVIRAFGGLAFLGAIIGALQLAGTMQSATGAPQQAAGAAMACAYAVIPYVLMRAVETGARKE